jgi:hypothetical protein|nr:MAG TPA: Head Tail Connector Protein [Caudoviricetes sp.]
MPYLTYEEFKTLTGKEDIPDKDFEKFLPKASAVLDSVTNNFYQFNDITDDRIAFRVNRFKLALCSQICYFHEVGADTFEGINSSPQSFSVGRTSVSNTSRFNPAGANESKSLLAEDIFIYLEGTGLLYRGVRSC